MSKTPPSLPSSLLDKRIILEPIIFADSEKFGAFTAICQDSDDILFIGTDGGFVLLVSRDDSGKFNLISARYVPSFATGCNLGKNKEIRKMTLSDGAVFVALDACLVKLPLGDCQTDENCPTESCLKYVKF